MKPKEHHLFREVQRVLRSQSRKIYLGMMNELFTLHEDHDFVHILRGHFRSRRYDLALDLADQLSAQTYADATTHFVANQFSLLIRKFPWRPDEVKTSPESKAILTFLRAERRCKLLNKRFSLYASQRSPNEFFLSKVRNFVSYVLGDEPDLEWILDNSEFGGGASLGVHGNATNLARKFLANPWSVTPGALTYAYWSVMRDPHLRESLSDSRNFMACLDPEHSYRAYRGRTRIVKNNKLSFVPKTAKTHRAIAVEPLLNGFLQKGSDLLLRRKLKRIGIDLSDQTANQRLARAGSLSDADDSYATIDLSSASDSISIGLARFILPPAWFEFLNSIRSTSYDLNGKIETYHKFCSMGNGFCFPLESLIFAACCHASGSGVPGQDFSVYGDDIIVRKRHATEVLKGLKILGFLPNAEKTFLSGPFRESCGSDWFNGDDVRPYTLDHELDSLSNLFKFLNLTRRNERSTSFFGGVEDFILSHIPTNFQFWRPFKGDPDSGIDVFGSEHMTSRNCFYDRRSWTWICRTLQASAVPDKVPYPSEFQRGSADMYALLRGTRSGKRGVEYTVRRKARTSVVRKSYSGATAMLLPDDRGFDRLLRFNGIVPRKAH